MGNVPTVKIVYHETPTMSSFLAEKWPVLSALPSPSQFRKTDTLGPGEAGLYLLLQGDVIVYIGQSSDVRNRLQQHRAEGKKQFDGSVWFPCINVGDRLRYEGILILAAVPRYNRSCNLGITNDGRVYDLTRSTYSRLADAAKRKKTTNVRARLEKGVATRRRTKPSGD